MLNLTLTYFTKCVEEEMYLKTKLCGHDYDHGDHYDHDRDGYESDDFLLSYDRPLFMPELMILFLFL